MLGIPFRLIFKPLGHRLLLVGEPRHFIGALLGAGRVHRMRLAAFHVVGMRLLADFVVDFASGTFVPGKMIALVHGFTPLP